MSGIIGPHCPRLIRSDLLPPGKPGVDLMPGQKLRFTPPPAEQDPPAIQSGRKVYQTVLETPHRESDSFRQNLRPDQSLDLENAFLHGAPQDASFRSIGISWIVQAVFPENFQKLKLIVAGADLRLQDVDPREDAFQRGQQGVGLRERERVSHGILGRRRRCGRAICWGVIGPGEPPGSGSSAGSEDTPRVRVCGRHGAVFGPARGMAHDLHAQPSPLLPEYELILHGASFLVETCARSWTGVDLSGTFRRGIGALTDPRKAVAGAALHPSIS
jgi:hypothetical protein